MALYDELLLRFDGAADLEDRTASLPDGQTVHVLFLDGMVSGSEVAEFVLQPLTRGDAATGASRKNVTGAADAAKLLVNGFCIVLRGQEAAAYEVKTGEKRGPSAPEVENTVKGAKDAFTETVRTNTSLLRRHLRTPELRLKEVIVGRESLTNITVCSVQGVTDPALVAQTVRRLEEIRTDGILSPAAVEDFLTGARKTAFPLLQYTERPDRMAQGLLEGRVGVLVDGLPLGYLLPVDLGRLMQSPEDRGGNYIVASCVRVLRYLALLVSLLLPAAYVAMVTYQPEMIPTQLLLSIRESRQAVPFPLIFEVLGLLVAFELLQEAGIHLPQAIGQTVSIIGGLVVGTAAVEAKLISPAALIVVSVAGICGFTLPGNDFSDAVRVWRFGLAILAAVAGLFGLTAGVLALLIHLSGLESLGTPYLNPFSGARSGGAVLRAPVPEEEES